MARRRRVVRPRIEPPLWYRVFDLAAWDEPDSHEQAMIDGSRGYPTAYPGALEWRGLYGWPQWLHEHHARRRWGEAKGKYRDANPELATQEFQDIVNGHAARYDEPFRDVYRLSALESPDDETGG